MKKIISILLIFCMLSVLLVSCGNNTDSTNDDDKQTIGSQYSKGLAFEATEGNPNECIITGIGSCTDKNIVIPSLINGMRVVGIKDGAFSPKTQLVKGSKKVADVLASEITNTMISSTDSESSNSSSGGIIIFDQYQTSNSPLFNNGSLSGSGEAYETGTGTPIDLEEIKSVKIPVTVKEIGDEAFYGCENLDSINTHSSLSTIGEDAFKETAYYNNPQNWDGKALYLNNYLLTVSTNYSGEFKVKEGTTMIADKAFYNCTYITTVTPSSTLTVVGNYAFSGCTSFTGFNFAENSVSYTYTYGAGAFDGCTSIIYKPYLPGNGTNTPSYENSKPSVDEKYPTRFDRITKEEFDNVRENKYNNYSVETTNNKTGDKAVLWIDNSSYYYTASKNGAITTEMYGVEDENGIVTYMVVDNKLYLTTAEIPDSMLVFRELEFEDLHLYDTETSTYAYFYEEGNDENRVEFGFREGKRLVYIKLVMGDEGFTTYFYDFDKTNAPSLPSGDIVYGIIVDENGNIK